MHMYACVRTCVCMCTLCVANIVYAYVCMCTYMRTCMFERVVHRARGRKRERERESENARVRASAQERG